MDSKLILRLLPVFIAIAIDIMGFGLVQPVLTEMFGSSGILSKNASESIRFFYLGLGYLLYPLCMFFGAPLLGDLSDAIGRKKTLVLSLFGLFVGYMCMSAGVYIHMLTLFFIGRMLTGFLSGCQPVAQATIADVSPLEDKAKNMGVVVFVVSAGLLLGPFIGGFFSDTSLVTFFGYYLPFFITGFFALIASLWIFIRYEESYIVRTTVPFDVLRPLKILRHAFEVRSLRLLVPLFFLMQIGLGTYYQYILVDLHMQFGYSSLYLGLFSTWLGLFFTLSLLLLLPKLTEKFFVEHIAAWSLFACGLSILIAGIFENQVLQWVLAMPIAAGNNIAYAMIMATFSNQVDQARQGWVNGLFISTMALGFCINALLANFIPIVGVHGVLVIGGAVYLLSALLMCVFCKIFPLKGIPKERKSL